MANAKEQFGLSEKPEIHGVVEHETEPVAADEYSKQVEASLKKPETPKAKAVNKKVPAFKLTVRGNVRNGEKMEAYSADIVIPECPDTSMQLFWLLNSWPSSKFFFIVSTWPTVMPYAWNSL